MMQFQMSLHIDESGKVLKMRLQADVLTREDASETERKIMETLGELMTDVTIHTLKQAFPNGEWTIDRIDPDKRETL